MERTSSSVRFASAGPDDRRGVRAPATRALSSKPLPEVHIIGEIVGGTAFTAPVCCKFAVEAGDRWEWLAGSQTGQTQTAHAESGDEVAVWAHPLDLHYVVGTMHGWPRLLVQVWEQDTYGRLDIAGYGFLHLPAAPGSYDLSCCTWRPVASAAQEFSAFFLGGHPSLKTTAVLGGGSGGGAAAERFRLMTTAAGTVHVRVDVLVRHMEAYGVEW